MATEMVWGRTAVVRATIHMIMPKIPVAGLPLCGDDVHVWGAALDLPAVRLASLNELLSPDERRRAGGFRFDVDRRRFIAARGLLRVILGHYLGMPPRQVTLTYGEQGKPQLAPSAAPADLSFNLAHSAGLAVYALRWGRPVGVDLEEVRSLPDLAELVAGTLSPREQAQLSGLPLEQQTEAFFKCWTRKEAYLKATGQGLAGDLSQVEVSLAPGEPARLISVNNDVLAAAQWTLHDLSLHPSYVACVAVPGPAAGVSLRHWDRDHAPQCP